MSTVICIKDGDSLVLGTDSRFMKSDFSAIASDAVQKLWELAPGCFFATCGWSASSDFLAQKAPELVQELGTDIRVLAAGLDRAVRPYLRELADALATLPPHSRIADTLAGREPIQGFLLAGRSNGKLGMIYHEFYLQDGQVTSTITGYFDQPRHIQIVNPAAAKAIRDDPRTWSDSPVRVMLATLEKQKRASPFIGGQSQIAIVDGKGGRWVNRPPAAAMRTAEPVCATITAAVSMTAPTITITTGGTTINLDATNQFKVSKSGFSAQIGTSVSTSFGSGDGLAISGSSGNAQVAVSATGLQVGGASGTGGPYASINSSGASAVNGGSSAGLLSDGFYVNASKVVSSRVVSTPVTLADVIAILQHHGLSN